MGHQFFSLFVTTINYRKIVSFCCCENGCELKIVVVCDGIFGLLVSYVMCVM